MKTFEITGAGFHSSTDATDDRVFWVNAASREEVDRAIEGFGGSFHGEVGVEPGAADIDFVLPQGLDDFRVQLSRCCARSYFPSAEYVFGCFYGATAKTPHKTISIFGDSQAKAHQQAVNKLGPLHYESIRFIEMKPNPAFITNQNMAKLWFDAVDKSRVALALEERLATPALAIGLRLEMRDGRSAPNSEDLLKWIKDCLNCNTRHMLAHVAWQSEPRCTTAPGGSDVVDLSLNLLLKRCDHQPAMTPQECLVWISSCLNCNVNRIAVEVSLAGSDAPAERSIERSRG